MGFKGLLPDADIRSASAIGVIGGDVQVQFGDVPDDQLQYAVIAAIHGDQWVFVRHAQRHTWELPGGHIEPGEAPLDAARRELTEESGANGFDIWPVSTYSVNRGGAISRGLLCFAAVKSFGEIPSEFEMAERRLFDGPPANLTYREIIPGLMQWAQEWLNRRAARVYFIRHAESDQSVHDDAARPLTGKGMADAAKLVDKLKYHTFDAIYTSPYLRAVQTVTPLAKARKLPLQTVNDLRERKIGSEWIADYDGFARKQWADHDHKLSGGESIADAQRRNIAALHEILDESAGKTIAIGTHGGCLGAILNHYDPAFGYEQFQALLPKLPCVYGMCFIGHTMIGVKEI